MQLNTRPHSRQVTRSCWGGWAINNSPQSPSLPLSQYGQLRSGGMAALRTGMTAREASGTPLRSTRAAAVSRQHMSNDAQHSHKALPALKLHRGSNVCPAGTLYDVRLPRALPNLCERGGVRVRTDADGPVVLLPQVWGAVARHC